MKPTFLPLLSVVVTMAACPGLDAADATTVEAACKALAKAVREEKLDDLAIITLTNEPRMAESVLGLIGQRRLPPAVRARITDLVAAWPDGPGRAALGKQVLKSPRCDDETLLFVAGLGLPGTEPLFRAVMTEQRGKPPAELRNPVRVAAAIRGLGRFPAQSDAVVAYLGTCLDAAVPHAIRASTAAALGGMRNAGAVKALIPHVNDPAIGDVVLRSLFQLTGQDHGEDAPRWQEWLKAQAGGPELKMLSQKEWDGHQAARRKAEAAGAGAEQPDMSSFYGVRFRARVALFILDVSGSMYGARIEKLRSQMTNLLLAMRNSSAAPQYGIVTFSSGVDSCFSGQGIEDTRESSLRKATRYVENLPAEGDTAMAGALTYAGQQIMPGGNVDTVFFLSDGEPSDGTPENVLGITRALFDRHRVRFNTIEITGQEAVPGVPPPPPPPAPPDMPAEPSLLEKMALATGGTYTKPQGWVLDAGK